MDQPVPSSTSNQPNLTPSNDAPPPETIKDSGLKNEESNPSEMKEDVLADRKRSFNLLCDETINQPLIPPENETKEQKESNSNKPECTFIKHDSRKGII